MTHELADSHRSGGTHALARSVKVFRAMHPTCARCQHRQTALVRQTTTGLVALCRGCGADDRLDRKIASQRAQAALLQARGGR